MNIRDSKLRLVENTHLMFTKKKRQFNLPPSRVSLNQSTSFSGETTKGSAAADELAAPSSKESRNPSCSCRV